MPRSAHARFTMATKRAPLDLPQVLATLARLRVRWPFAPGCETEVAPRLAGDRVPVPLQERSELAARDVPRELQTAITSSLTRCRRMTRGLSFSSK